MFLELCVLKQLLPYLAKYFGNLPEHLFSTPKFFHEFVHKYFPNHKVDKEHVEEVKNEDCSVSYKFTFEAILS